MALSQETKAQIRNAILRCLNTAPKGKRGARGKLVHLQDSSFFTEDAELLMVCPTIGLSILAAQVSKRSQASQRDVKIVVDEMVERKIIAVSSSRRFQGVPKLIPIVHEKGFHTDKIGTFSNGQYAGFVFGAPVASVLHTFDKFGFHVESFAWNSETGCDAEEELDKAIGSLFRPYPGDIQIQLFETELLGQTFGLVKSDKEHVEYIPLGFGFDPPWNGCYNT